MTLCVRHTMDKFLAQAPLLLAATLLSACAGQSSKPTSDGDSQPEIVIDDQQTTDAEGAQDEQSEEAVAPKDPETLFAEALSLMRQRKNAEAEAAFVALAEAHPEFSGPHTNLGILFAKDGRQAAAINSLTKAAQLNPENATAFIWIGILSRQGGDTERAIQAFEKAISADPSDPAPHMNLGLLYEQMGQADKAIEAYRRYRQTAGEEDLRVLPWIAELEAGLGAPAAAQLSAESGETELEP